MDLTLPLIAFGATALLHGIALLIFPCVGLLDFPERYGHIRSRLPYPTGIIAVVVFLVIFSVTSEFSLQVLGVLSGIALLAIVTFIDDRWTLPPTLRLFTQALVAFLVFATGSRIYSLTNPLLPDGIVKLDTVDIHLGFFGALPLLSGIFTLFWLLLTMNALNWFDGIPGQVSTLSGIGFTVIGLLSISDRVGQHELGVLAFVLAGIAWGGMLFDFPPPRVLMGDTGAMFFGLLLGILTIYAGGKVATAFLVLGVPLIDLAIVAARRVLSGKNPLKGSRTGEHLHHRLLEKGWSPRRIILFTALLGSIFGVTALFLSTQGKLIAAMVLFLIMLGLSYYSSPKTLDS